MSDDDGIRELDAATVDRIAAGEVVERPASAVKELVENSLDAGATRVRVAVDGDGTDGTRVSDDGVGMSETAVRKAVRKHTTSKIRDVDDLEAGVASLGFRGEALATIGAVSRLTVTTRPRDAADASATRLRLEGGDVTEVAPAGRGPGTTVAVDDLFFNTPARRKYLKTETTEFARINRVVTRYALANPDVAVSLEHNGREVFATTGQGDLTGAVMAVYGREVAESMVRVEATPEGTVERVWGYVSDPETTRSTREYLSTFVNGRYVEERALREAILAAYGRQLAPDRFPFAVLFVELPAGGVDVNVHPRKMAVRFDDEDGVRRGVERAVEATLLDAGLVRRSAPRGRSAPDETPVAPETGVGDSNGSEAGREGGSDDGGDGEVVGSSPPETGRGGDAGETGDPPEPGDAGEANETRVREDGAPGAVGDGPASTADAGVPSTPTQPTQPVTDSEGSTDEGADGIPDESGFGGRDGTPVEPTPNAWNAGDDRKFRPESHNARLSGAAADEGTPRRYERLPSMRVLGQFRDTYLVAETEDGLVLVDQHAADERVHYERLCERAAESGGSQALVECVELELTAGEAAAFEDALPDLRELGFVADAERDGRVARVSAVPVALSGVLDADLLRDALGELLAGSDGSDAVTAAADALLADMACRPAVTGNTSLAEGSVVGLLDALDDCENPYACPHGRPTIIEVSDAEIADRFERDYPGHATRRPE